MRAPFILAILLLAAPAFADEAPWQVIFDGKSLDGWKAADHAECFTVKDGNLVAGGGPMAHLFYVGPVGNHDFKNFELKAEVKTTPKSNSGIFFHTEPQSGFLKKGYEAQICNACVDKRRTGSLLVVKDILDTSPVKDDEQRVLSHGPIALQAHDPNSIVLYRKISVKVLPD